MPRKPLPPHILEARGAFTAHPERRPAPVETSAVSRLADESLTAIEPCPTSVQDARGVALWEELVARLFERGTLTRDLLRLLERYVLLQTALWRAAESGKLPTAALSRELSNLEGKLGLVDAVPEVRAPRNNLWAKLRRAAEAADAEELREVRKRGNPP